MEEIAQALGISHGSVSTILHDSLGMRKLTACWVPKSLSDEQMATRASVCSALLKCFRSKDDFLLLLVTVDETWVHYYEPENKAQSSMGRAWVPKAKEVQDATICWQGDGHSILGCKRRYYVGLFTQEKSITGVYYANLLDSWELPSVKNAEVNSLKVFCCESRHLQSCNGCCIAKLVWINTTSCLFAWPSS